jgi:hypothetical protein
VQHHPRREHLLDGLLPALGSSDVVTDPDPDARLRSAWRTYALALEQTPEWATHRVIVQDDAQPCADFPARLEERIAERPDRLIALYLGGFPLRTAKLAREAHAQGERWVDFHTYDWVGTVGIVWPVALIEPFLSFAAQKYRRHHGGDDGKVGQFVMSKRIRACATIPSLLDHPDVEPSIYAFHRGAGRGRARSALFFAG